MEDAYPLNPTPLEDLLLTPDTLPFCAKESKPEDLPSSIGFDPQGHVHRLLGRFSSVDGKEGPIEKHRAVPFAQGPFPPGFHFLRGNLDQARDALGRGKGSVNPLRELGDFPGAHADPIEGKDGFGKFQRGPLPGGEDLGGENRLLGSAGPQGPPRGRQG